MKDRIDKAITEAVQEIVNLSRADLPYAVTHACVRESLAPITDVFTLMFDANRNLKEHAEELRKDLSDIAAACGWNDAGSDKSLPEHVAALVTEIERLKKEKATL